VQLTEPTSSHHDDALSQARAGQEVHHAQPLGEPEVPEGRGLQGDRVGGGPRRRGDLSYTQRTRLGWRQTRFGRQPAVQIRQLGEGLKRFTHLGHCVEDKTDNLTKTKNLYLYIRKYVYK